MTALSGDARERLAAALNGLTVDNPMWIGDDGEPLEYLPEREALIANFLDDAADALAPVVAEIADQRAAEELRAAANELHVLRFNADDDPTARWPEGAPQVTPDCFYRGVVLATLALCARADSLTTPTSEGTTR